MTDAVAAISEWVRQESFSRDAAGVNAMMDIVERDVAGLPIEVERVAGQEGLGDALVLRAGPRNNQPHVLVMSHLDTVHAPGTIAKDLVLRVEGDRLYGPGVYDMKGGAWLALQAFKDAVTGGALQRPVTFLFSPDEEIGSPTSRKLIEDLSRGARAALVTEPARLGGKIVTARKGTGGFEVEIEGRASHAGVHHDKGRNAILEAAHQVIALQALTDYAAGTTLNVGIIEGGSGVNVVPQFARLRVDFRVTTAAAGEALMQKVLALKPVTPDVRVTITGAMNRPPYEKSAEVVDLLSIAQRLAAEIGFDLEDNPMTGGGSDGNFSAALGVPTLDGLGIDGDGAHTLQEYALISSIAPRRALMKALLEAL